MRNADGSSKPVGSQSSQPALQSLRLNNDAHHSRRAVPLSDSAAIFHPRAKSGKSIWRSRHQKEVAAWIISNVRGSGMCVMRTACFAVCEAQNNDQRFNYFWLSFESRRARALRFHLPVPWSRCQSKRRFSLPLFIRISLHVSLPKWGEYVGAFPSAAYIYTQVSAPFNVSLTLRASRVHQREASFGPVLRKKDKL